VLTQAVITDKANSNFAIPKKNRGGDGTSIFNTAFLEEGKILNRRLHHIKDQCRGLTVMLTNALSGLQTYQSKCKKLNSFISLHVV
jgi:hypothetical protein